MHRIPWGRQCALVVLQSTFFSIQNKQLHHKSISSYHIAMRYVSSFINSLDVLEQQVEEEEGRILCLSTRGFYGDDER